MGKVAFIVDRAKLEQAISKVESGGPLATRNELYKRVADLYNADSPPKAVTSSVVALRLKSWGISMKTPIGQRGRPKKQEVVEV